MEDGMTDDVVHPCQSEDGASENSVSECNGITFPTEYLHTSQMTNGLTCTQLPWCWMKTGKRTLMTLHFK